MRIKIFLIFLFVFLIGFTTSLPVCSDTNQQDISNIPCQAFTIPINCSGNITIFNATDVDINSTVNTTVFVDNIYNFTLNLSIGNYELVDCENNTALFEVGLFEQGYGTSLFSIMFPSILLTIISLFVSGRMFKKLEDHDEEQEKSFEVQNGDESFIPKSRLLPIVFMLFAFIPMIFMVGFINLYLESYLSTANITSFYGSFYILFSVIFYFVALISFVVWLSSFIKLRSVMKDLDDIE